MPFYSSVRRLAAAGSLLAVLFFCIPADSAIPAGYKGFPYLDSIQPIPGRLRMFRFDQGKVGKTGGSSTLDVGAKEVTWHDFNSANNWACDKRNTTGVGLQLIGGFDQMESDWTGPNYLVSGECYLAETNSGDWTKYTVNVKQAGIYGLSFFHTAAPATGFGPYVSIASLNGTDSVSTGTDTLKLTHGGAYDFHTWWYKEYGRISLDTGLQVIRFDVTKTPPGNGPMNVNYIDFTYVGPTSAFYSGSTVPKDGSFSLKNIACNSGSGIKLDFITPSSSPVNVQVFNARGALVSTGTLNKVAAGPNKLSLSTNVHGSGMFVVQISQGNKTAQGKVFLFAK